MSLRLHPAALEDLQGAIDWYAARSPRTAERFLHDTERVLDQIASAPHRFPFTSPTLRRAVFRHFPYSIVFRESADSIDVIAVAHSKRRPRFWQLRLDD